MQAEKRKTKGFSLPTSLLLGTHNPARIEMVRGMLRETAVRVLTLAELGIHEEVEEDGDSTETNALKKSRFYFSSSGIPTLAIDGGLHIDRFPPEKQPGVLVKRLPGAGGDLLDYYIQTLREVGGESPGTWTASIALAIAPDRVLSHTYTFAVLFSTERRGDVAPGRLLDPIMIDPASGRYYTELAVEERPYYASTRDFLLRCLPSLPVTASTARGSR